MTRRQVNAFLIAWLIVTWSAVLFRIDRFPLTWAPMYSTFTRSDSGLLSRRAESQARVREGLRVTRRDGSKGTVGPDDLNISKWIMSRIYYQRAFGKSPVKKRQANMNISDFNRWVHGLEEGEERYDVDWEKRLFWTLNKTLGHEPDDPEFIVGIRATEERLYYDVRDLSLAKRKTKKAKLRWKEEWAAEWESGGG